jgi:hypothetical protein
VHLSVCNRCRYSARQCRIAKDEASRRSKTERSAILGYDLLESSLASGRSCQSCAMNDSATGDSIRSAWTRQVRCRHQASSISAATACCPVGKQSPKAPAWLRRCCSPQTYRKEGATGLWWISGVIEVAGALCDLRFATGGDRVCDAISSGADAMADRVLMLGKGEARALTTLLKDRERRRSHGRAVGDRIQCANQKGNLREGTPRGTAHKRWDTTVVYLADFTRFALNGRVVARGPWRA